MVSGVAQIKRGAVCAALIGLAACGAAPVPKAPARLDLRPEIHAEKPADAAADTCWQHDTTPAVYETITEQRRVSGGDGLLGSYRSTTHQRQVSERAEVWFQTLCPADMTLELVATLQRALTARGLLTAPLTGTMDPPTAEALRAYQAAAGLNSAHLAVATARDLGLISTDPGRL